MDEAMVERMWEREDRELRVALEYYACDDLPRLRIYVEGKTSIGSEPSVLHYDDDGFSVDLAMADAVRDLRNALARFGIVGRLVFRDEDCWLEGEDGAEVLRAIESLPPEELRVSWVDVVRTQDEELENLRRQQESRAELADFTRAQQKDEGEALTLGEAISRHKEGTEQLRGMLDASDDDPPDSPADPERS